MNAPPPDNAPTRIGNRYRLDERIGAGAMGVVWRGTDELLNRTVAVKELLAVVSPNGIGDAVEESRQRILREGRISARLQHPHVISMFDVVVYDERPWLVMEYLQSKSLAAVLSGDGPMEPRTAAEVGRQVADGLVAAHAAGVVHRDVKPGNVLITDDGLVKLTDFGVSRAIDDVQLTRTGLIAGTPAFLAPEVARGQEPKAASDVFALGATLYAAVEGTPPFGLDENAYALLHKVATGAIRPPEQAGPLTAVLMRLLDNEPDRRPTAVQARDALATVVAGRDRNAGGASTAVLAPAPVPAAGRFPAVGRRFIAAVGAGASASGTGSADAGVPGLPATAPSAHPPVSTSAGPGPSTVSDVPPPPRPRRFGRAGGILLAAGVVAAAGLGATAVALSGGNDPPEAPPAASSSVPVAPPATSQAVPTTAPTTTAEPTTAPTPDAPPTTADPTPAPIPDALAVTDPASFVQAYYALLPGNVDAAWPQLSAQAQSASGGRGGFDRFYAAMSAVSLENVRAVGENTVDATVVFVPNDGRPTTREPYRFVMATNDQGQTIMQSFSKL